MIKISTLSNRNLVTRVFPRLIPLSVGSLSVDIHVNSDWPCDYYVVVLGHSIEKLFTELHRPPKRRNIPCPAFHSQVFRFLGPVPAASLPTATQ